MFKLVFSGLYTNPIISPAMSEQAADLIVAVCRLKGFYVKRVKA